MSALPLPGLPRGYYWRVGVIWARTDPVSGMARSTGATTSAEAKRWKDQRKREVGDPQEYDALWEAFAEFSGSRIDFVYFVRARASDLIKIGWTTSYHERMRSLATTAPGGIAVNLVLRGDRSLERRAHRLFATLRVSGEWFRREGVLDRFMTEMAKEPVLHGPYDE